MNMKRFLMLFAAAVGLLTACVNDELPEPAGADKLAGVAAQVEAVMDSAEDLKALTDALGESGVEVKDASEAVAQHLAYIKDGASLEEASLAALDQQKKIAAVVGTVEGELLSTDAYTNELKDLFEAFHAGVSGWLGESFSVYYRVALAQAKVEFMASELSLQLEEQKVYVEALVSDVEAGLRKDEDPEGLKALASSVVKALEESETLVSGIASVASEVEKEYKDAVRTMVSDPASFDGQVLAELNTAALTKAGVAQSGLNDLASEVTKCKDDLAALQERLGLIEGAVDNLLGMIQSVTFMPLVSSENAVAYYSMDVNNKVSDSNLPYYGKAKRTAAGTVELNYIVRPAAASTALNANLDAVSVFGYYADRISTMSVNPSNYIDFKVTKVVATDAVRGVVTVTVEPNLKEAFYFKEVGAKCALSIKTGATDITSRFVEILPMDNSTKVYVTGVTPSEKSITLDKGEKLTLSATVAPSDATEKSYSWKSSNSNVVKIDASTGLLEAVGVGEATVTVTTHGVDEWGLPLTAECKVKVNEAFRLSGPPYVEIGYKAQLILDYPASAIIESKVWKSSDTSKAVVDENGNVTGVGNTYLVSESDYGNVTISCTINGVTSVSHNMKVVVTQPKSISVNGLSDSQNSLSMRVDEKLSLAATINPENVDPSHFRLYYSSDQGLGWIDSGNGMINDRGNQMAPCTAWVYIDVFNAYEFFYFAPGASLRRTVTVKVEPYYVKMMSFAQQTLTLAPGQISKLSPNMTSDVSGKLPTFTDLKWTSSNSEVVSVNEKTGEIETLAEGTSTITATTCNGWSVPSGSDQISASCTIVVKKPVDPVFVGDYFYSDGTWSTQLNRNKVLRGIVCQTGAPSATDKNLPTTCTNGYVISVEEISAKLDGDALVSADKFNTWAQNQGYYAIELGDGSWNGAKNTGAYGYSNTLAYTELTEQRAYDELGTSWNGSHYGGWDFYYTGGGLETFRNNNQVDTNKSSNWYVPSQREMTFVSDDVLTAVNAALSAAGKTQITNKNYKTSSYNTYGNAVVVNPVAKSANQQSVSTESSMRLFLAF